MWIFFYLLTKFLFLQQRSLHSLVVMAEHAFHCGLIRARVPYFTEGGPLLFGGLHNPCWVEK